MQPPGENLRDIKYATFVPSFREYRNTPTELGRGVQYNSLRPSSPPPPLSPSAPKLKNGTRSPNFGHDDNSVLLVLLSSLSIVDCKRIPTSEPIRRCTRIAIARLFLFSFYSNRLRDRRHDRFQRVGKTFLFGRWFESILCIQRVCYIFASTECERTIFVTETVVLAQKTFSCLPVTGKGQHGNVARNGFDVRASKTKNGLVRTVDQYRPYPRSASDWNLGK